jgi:hypothetical protein
MQILKLFIMIAVVLGITAPAVFAGGTVQGTVSFETDDGTLFYGEYLRVLLIREAIDVPALPNLDASKKFERMAAIRTAHVDFYIQARNKLSEDGFVVATQETTVEGTFVFENVYPGDYFILVIFPAMIRTYKVAWQFPVTVTDNQTVSVALNNSNMALPTYSR